MPNEQPEVTEVHTKITEALDTINNYLAYSKQAKDAIAVADEWAEKAKAAKASITELLGNVTIEILGADPGPDTADTGDIEPGPGPSGG